ncbi:MAG: hypothetical protein QF786_07915, partial [Vicinamibacterales bacterium]|nr:hypothetical protein [Vicinamibacterales bacterium]
MSTIRSITAPPSVVVAADIGGLEGGLHVHGAFGDELLAGVQAVQYFDAVAAEQASTTSGAAPHDGPAVDAPEFVDSDQER